MSFDNEDPEISRMNNQFTYATFGDDRLRGMGVARGRISGFSIDLRRRSYEYDTVALPCTAVRS